MSVSRFRFSKTQRVFLKQDVAFLFGHGQTFLVFPYKIVLAEKEKSDFPLKILISVPKNKFKHAVDRNKIKRRTREAFRLNSKMIEKLFSSEKSYFAGMIYIHDKLLDYEIVEKSMQKILKKIETIALGTDQ